MGTRSLTHFKENGDTLATIYRQYDGYMSGHGVDLSHFLKSKKIVITGSFEHFTRKDIEDKLVSEGAKIIKVISKNISFILVGNNPGSKLQILNKIRHGHVSLLFCTFPLDFSRPHSKFYPFQTSRPRSVD